MEQIWLAKPVKALASTEVSYPAKLTAVDLMYPAAQRTPVFAETEPLKMKSNAMETT